MAAGRNKATSAGGGGRNGGAAAATAIVGIGASAGGVEALIGFFDAMPADSGIAFVVVLHLDPTHESQMAAILASHTAMPVAEIADGMPIVSNHVYVIAPDQSLTVGDGRLHISKPAEPRGRRRPVDVLFASLAEDRREQAICIVLSGTGTNGTHGLKEVKARGGCSLVQDPATARFDGMPRSAIAANLADHVLPPENMPEVLLRYVRHAYFKATEAIPDATPDERSMLDPVLALLRLRSGHDFRSYKRSTLVRRIHRRMGLHNLEALADYADLLRTDSAEVRALVKDLMISVTGFFRDPEAWKALDDTVLAPLIAERKSGAAIRAWVPACATGEEAYSLAMLLAERAEAAQKQFDLKVFATDSQEDNLNAARSGVYPEAAVATIPEKRLRRFFNKLDGTYEIKRELRELVVFAPQNLLRDPPFSRLDLVTCRNLFIYLEPEAQKRVVALFHFALREGGCLFLGSAESIGRQDDLFDTMSKKWRVYRRIGPTRHDIVDFPVFPARERARPTEEEPAHRTAEQQPARMADLARRALLERYAPASVLIDQKGRALYFHGPTGDFLEPPTGEPTRDLLAMAREGLRAKLRGAVRQASANKQSVAFDSRIRQGETSYVVEVKVAPLASTSQTADLLLVSFERRQEPATTAVVAGQHDDVGHFDRALEDELKATRAELQGAIEQLESANEELKAANEEATSMNEELQSTNEELETSKEELQSYNEELYTVNNQLQHKIQEAEDANNDLSNLLSGTEIATVFLDADFRIKWFSPTSQELLDLQPSDLGRPLGHFALKFTDENLLRDAETVLAKLSRIEAEVSSGAGRWFLRRLLPYRTRDNRIVGVVATFVDITERKRAAEAVDEARLYAEAIVRTVRHPLLVLDGDLRVVTANHAFQGLFHVSPEESEGRLLHELGNRQWDIPQLRTLLSEILPQENQFDDFEVEHEFHGLGRRTMLLNACRLPRGRGRAALILLAIEDITARKQGEDALRNSEERYRTLFDYAPMAVFVCDRNAVIQHYNQRAVELWGREPERGVERHCGSAKLWLPTGALLPHEQSPIVEVLRTGIPALNVEVFIERPDGSRVLMLVNFAALRNAQGEISGAITAFTDITERKRIEELGQRLAAIVESSSDAIVSKDLNGVITSWNRGAARLFGYTAEEVIGEPVTILIPPDRDNEEPEILERIRRGEPVDYETVRRRKDGGSVEVSLTVSPIMNAEGRIIGASKIARDITERKQGEAHRELLIGELSHRVKNTLAAVQSIATLTLREGASPEAFVSAFEGRLHALGRVHELLVEADWAGAEIGRIARETLGPYGLDGEDRIAVDGPDLMVKPEAGVALAMILHELATNAAKYGALSAPDGRLAVTWRLNSASVHLRWIESDGPQVAPPSRRGFGSRLIEQGAAYELHGDARLDFSSDGLRCELTFPWTPPPAAQDRA